MKRFSALALGLALLCCCHLAFAADSTGVYVAGKGGLSFENSTQEGNVSGSYRERQSGTIGATSYSIQTMIQDIFSSSSHNTTNTAGAFGGAIGYDFQQYPFRVELEYLFRTQSSTNFSSTGFANTASSISLNGTPALNTNTIMANGTASFSRKDNIHTLMLNGYWDIVDYNGFIPYLGGGIGLAFHNLHDSANVMYRPTATFASVLRPSGYGLSKSQIKTCFAWMASAGVAYKINTNWTVDLGYRLISFGDTGTTSLGAAPVDSTTPGYVDSASIKGGTTLSNEVLLSVRYTF
jgi:opacity protein-like surface antigen